jgi:hypothetical protein
LYDLIKLLEEYAMKNIVVNELMALALLLNLFVSCAGTPATRTPYRPLSELPNAEILGTVQIKFDSIYMDHYLYISKLNETAYITLLEAAKQEYGGIIEVVDITWVLIRYNPEKQMSEYSASGKVVSLEGENSSNTATGIEGALERAAKQIMTTIQAGSKIAIVYVTSQDVNTVEFIAKELEYIMVNEGFTIIDRTQLDELRLEQNFQMSGEVDDETAVSIGKIVGANIIITGNVTGSESTRRLRLRVLNTQTAQVLAVASERL